MITGVSLNHGGQYYYRLHKPKVEELCVDELKDYFYKMLRKCPTDNFLVGPRSSVLKFDVGSGLEEKDHEVKFLARMGLESNYYGEGHLNVQMFMLAYDKNTVAIEVPIWLNPSEVEGYEEFFNSQEPLSGHIDIVRVENGKVWIWDYKPNAHREKYADTQTFFYALMLSKRTSIPLSEFRCGYFDDKKVYTFDPSSVSSSKLKPFKSAISGLTT